MGAVSTGIGFDSLHTIPHDFLNLVESWFGDVGADTITVVSQTIRGFDSLASPAAYRHRHMFLQSYVCEIQTLPSWGRYSRRTPFLA